MTTVGILNGGQLGRMLGLASIPLGINVQFIDPIPGAGAGKVGPLTNANFDDEAAIRNFASNCDVLTYEWEGVPASVADYIGNTPLRPGKEPLMVSQERKREKQFFVDCGIPIPSVASADSVDELSTALDTIGTPAVVKTRSGGYDGKGQAVVREATQPDALWKELGAQPLIVEQFVPFDREVSMIGVRGLDGSSAFYPLVENVHKDGILRRSVALDMDSDVSVMAQKYVGSLMDQFEYVGVLTVEFFDVDDQLMANEFAPRVHNSGHWTIEGSYTSQFANHMRAITGLPLGDTRKRGPAGMCNCIGSLPDRDKVLRIPGAYFHDYGKESRPGRKVGHVNVIADTDDELAERVSDIEALMVPQ